MTKVGSAFGVIDPGGRAAIFFFWHVPQLRLSLATVFLLFMLVRGKRVTKQTLS